MSKKLSIHDEGDHVECTQCTCLPSVSEEQNDDVNVKCHFSRSYLQNWEKWLTARKRIHDHLTKSLNRPASDLLMNQYEQCREIQEERLMFQYSSINTYFDRYRGNPAFWKLPAGLREKCSLNRNPVYFANLTKVEQNEIPFIERVVTPNYVKAEKGLLPYNRQIYTTRQADKHTNMKVLHKITKTEPHKPDCEELIVIGRKARLWNNLEEHPVSRNSRDFKNIEGLALGTGGIEEKVVLNKLSQEKLEDRTTEGAPIIPKTSFIINQTVVTGYNNFASSVLKIRLVFESTTNMSVPEVKFLDIRNTGLTTIRIYWNRVEKFLLFSDLIKCDREDTRSFYFNKNELLLPPETQVYFPIWFKSCTMGNYFELWEIKTKPQLWDDDYQLIINLQAFVYPDNFEEKSIFINEIIDERVSHTVIRGVLNEILQHLKFSDSKTEIYEFTEKQIFESANQELWGVEKRPKYIYDKKAVLQLKSLYKEVALPKNSPKNWNYCIKNLRMIARQKDIWMYVENKTMDMLRGKLERMHLHKKSIDSDENPLQAIEMDSSLIDDVYNETYCHRVDNISHRLERPSMIPNTERLKYFTAFTILRNFSFKICDALERYYNPAYSADKDALPNYNHNNVYAIEQLPERLIFERFDDIWIDRMKQSPSQTGAEFTETPKIKALRGIPVENTRLVYKTYFNALDAEEKKKKELTAKENEKSIKDIEKSVKSREATNIDQTIFSSLIKEGFDPFEVEFYGPKMSLESEYANCEKSSAWEIDPSSGLDYYKYLMVYSLLTNAIEAMVDALETFKENILDTEVLGELVKCNDMNLTEFQSLPEEESAILEKRMFHQETKTAALEVEPFFHKLIESHLYNNVYTKEYIVEGRRKSSREENVQSNCLESPESGSLSSWVFKSHESLDLSLKSNASVEVQTSEIDYNSRDISNVPIQSSPSFASVSTNESVSQEVFYIMDDERDC